MDLLNTIAIVGLGVALFIGFGVILVVVDALMDRRDARDPEPSELEDFTRSMNRWGYVPAQIWKRGK